MLNKTKKSVTTRIRVTRTGKMIRRRMGANHFLAKKTGKQISNKKNQAVIAAVDLRALQRYR